MLTQLHCGINGTASAFWLDTLFQHATNSVQTFAWFRHSWRAWPVTERAEIRFENQVRRYQMSVYAKHETVGVEWKSAL